MTQKKLNVKQIAVPKIQGPSQRINHTVLNYQNCMYLYGGFPTLEDKDYVYKLNMNSFLWSRYEVTGIKKHALRGIYSHSCVLYGNYLFIIGGKIRINSNYQYSKDFWTLSMDNFMLRKQDYKGNLPVPRESAQMILNKNYLLLYGGRFNNLVLNDISLYKIQAKMWFSIDGNYQFMILVRYKPAICSVGDKIYLFGGETISNFSETHTQFLNDFYELKVLEKPSLQKPDLQCRRIITSLTPPQKSGHYFMVFFPYLILLGGQNYYSSHFGSQNSNIWLYHLRQCIWNRISIGFLQLFAGSSCCFIQSRLYFYGGYQPYITSEDNQPTVKYKCHVTVLEFNLESQKEINDKKNIDVFCNHCTDKLLQFGQPAIRNSQIIESSISEYLCPFTAIGLLLDNCLILSANNVSIEFNQNEVIKYCRIEDDGQVENLWPNRMDMLHEFLRFTNNDGKQEEVQEENQHQQIQKVQGQKGKENYQYEKDNQQAQLKESQLKAEQHAAKKAFAKQQSQRKQFMTNLKLGALRIAKSCLFISTNIQKQIVTVILIELQRHDTYRCHYFMKESQKLVNPKMRYAEQYISQKYNQCIDKTISKLNITNVVYLLDLRTKQLPNKDIICQIQINLKQNDVICTADLNLCKQICHNSLRAYISLLYLKKNKDNQNLRVELATGKNFKQIILCESLILQVDAILKNVPSIIDLEEVLDLQQCTVMQLYCLSSSDIPLQICNGILIYHRNRLIQVLSSDFTSDDQSPLRKETSRIFGFIEVKEYYECSMFKTSFKHEQFLKQIQSRLKYITQYQKSTQMRKKIKNN